MGRKAMHLDQHCPYCKKRSAGQVRSKGLSGTKSRKVQRFVCLVCKRSFSSSNDTGMYRRRKTEEEMKRIVARFLAVPDETKSSERTLSTQLKISRALFKTLCVLTGRLSLLNSKDRTEKAQDLRNPFKIRHGADREILFQLRKPAKRA